MYDPLLVFVTVKTKGSKKGTIAKLSWKEKYKNLPNKQAISHNSVQYLCAGDLAFCY